MKKTTKILLVLAAVVAMTIGAVSTVMAADGDVVIGAWGGDADKGWTATDVDGNPIVRGWATKDGFWYFFDSSKMLTNAFVTWKDEVYFLDGNGHMAVGWIGFAKDQKVKMLDKYEAVTYDNVVAAWGTEEDANGAVIFAADSVFEEDETYETMWCYFYGDGTMAMDEWYKAWDLHYYSLGAFCIMGDYDVAIDADKKDGVDGIYGFSGYGNMHVGWINYDFTTAAKKDGLDAGTPFEGAGSDKKIASSWTYYHSNGKQVDLGWEKIDGQWCYFVDDLNNSNDKVDGSNKFKHLDDNVLGAVLLTDTLITDGTTDAAGIYDSTDASKKNPVFYVDANGYMVTGSKTFGSEYKLSLGKDNVDGATAVAWGMQSVKKDQTDTYYFNPENGGMMYGLVNNYYYNNPGSGDEIYNANNAEVADAVTQSFITIVAGDFNVQYAGERVESNNFFLVTYKKDDNGNATTEIDAIRYFESGRLIQNDAIKFGGVVIGIKDGKVVGLNTVADYAADKEIVVDGFKYKFVTTSYVELGGITINGLVKK